jgi:hypothetical protein
MNHRLSDNIKKMERGRESLGHSMPQEQSHHPSDSAHSNQDKGVRNAHKGNRDALKESRDHVYRLQSEIDEIKKVRLLLSDEVNMSTDTAKNILREKENEIAELVHTNIHLSQKIERLESLVNVNKEGAESTLQRHISDLEVSKKRHLEQHSGVMKSVCRNMLTLCKFNFTKKRRNFQSIKTIKTN